MAAEVSAPPTPTATDRAATGARSRSRTSERRRLEARLRHDAEHDPLTGLLTRRRFDEERDCHAIDCVRYGAHGALLLVDLDDFTPVNDRLGHAAGDAVLRRVAEVLRDNLRGSDRIGRLGDDEFAILLPRGTADEAEQVAENVVTALREDPKAQITASVGVAGFEGARDTPGRRVTAGPP